MSDQTESRQMSSSRWQEDPQTLEQIEKDISGGPWRAVLLAMLALLPVMKVGYTTGSTSATQSVLSSVGVVGWIDIWLTTLASNPLLTTVWAAAVSRLLYAYISARAIIRGTRRSDSLFDRFLLAAIAPIAIGIGLTVFFGIWWGVVAALLSLLQLGVVLEHDLSNRSSKLEAIARFERRIVTGLILVAVPLVTFGAVFNGNSWAPVNTCTVDTPESHRADLVVLSRDPTGITGWEPGTASVVSAHTCEPASNERIRSPLWD